MIVRDYAVYCSLLLAVLRNAPWTGNTRRILMRYDDARWLASLVKL